MTLLTWAAQVALDHLPENPRWRVVVPGITMANGVWMPTHERVVGYDGVTPIVEIASGGGNAWQRSAHAKLSERHPQWDALPVEHRALHVLALATDMRDGAVCEATRAKVHRWWVEEGVGQVTSAKAAPNPLWEYLNAPLLAMT